MGQFLCIALRILIFKFFSKMKTPYLYSSSNPSTFILNYDEGDRSLHNNKLSKYTISPHDEIYTIREGDTLDDIAKYKLGDSRLWFILAEVNINLVDIFRLEVGTTLIIPKII